MKQTIFNKTIVITGASSGAGRAMALELARHGAKLVLAARRAEALEELVIECSDLGAKALPVKTDMREVEDIRRLAEVAFQFGGAIDVWINNAGVLAAGALEDVPPEVNEAVIKTNLLGYMHSAHIVLPYFKTQRQGMLINNISVGGWFPTPYATAYTASKFGLRGFSEALKGELQGWPHIHVCDMYPGFLDTPGMQHAANFTGKALKPAPPVYSPQKLARAVAAVIQSPAEKTTVGLGATLLRLAWLLFPRISRAATVAVMRTYLKKAPELPVTTGNVVGSVEYGTSVEGGWRKPVALNVKTTTTALVAAATIGLFFGWLAGKNN
jgi:short-subunit dehydrogenase